MGCQAAKAVKESPMVSASTLDALEIKRLCKVKVDFALLSRDPARCRIREVNSDRMKCDLNLPLSTTLAH